MFVVTAINVNIKMSGNFRLARTVMLQTACVCENLTHQAEHNKTRVPSSVSQFLSISPYFCVVLPQIYRSISELGTPILGSVSSS